MTLDELRRTAEARGIATQFTDAAHRTLRGLGGHPEGGARRHGPGAGGRGGVAAHRGHPDRATLQLAGAGGGHAGAGGGRGTAAAGRAARRPAPGPAPGRGPDRRHHPGGRARALPPAAGAGRRRARLGLGGPALRGPLAVQLGHRRPARPGRAAGRQRAPGRGVRPAQPVARRPPGGAEPLQPVQPGVPQPAVPPGRGRARAGRPRPAGAGTGRGAGRRRPRPARPGPDRPAGRLPAQGRGPAPGPRRPRPGPRPPGRAGRLHRRHREPGAVRHLLRPPARPRQRLARLAGRLPPSRPARGGRLRRPSTARRSATTPGSSGCSTSSWRPPGRATGSSGW